MMVMRLLMLCSNEVLYVDHDFGPGVEVDEDDDKEEDGSQSGQGHRHGFLPRLGKLSFPLLFLPSILFRLALQLTHLDDSNLHDGDKIPLYNTKYRFQKLK